MAAQSRVGLDLTLRLTIRGDYSAGFSFHDPVSAVVLATGVVALADSHAGNVLFFERDGSPLRVAGRNGDGPGEFRHVLWLGNCAGDSVHVWDPVRRLLVVLGPRGDFVREFRLAIAGTSYTPFTLSCSRGGVLAFQPQPRPDPGTAAARFSRGVAPVVVTDAALTRIEVIPDVPSTEVVLVGGGGVPRPLGKGTLVAAGTDQLVLGTSDSASIVRYARDGRRISSGTAGVAGRTPTTASYARAVEEIVGNIRGVRMSGIVRDRLLSVSPPDGLPPYRAVFLDPRGNVWVDVAAPGETSSLLEVTDPAGQPLGRFHLPGVTRVTHVGDDSLVGVALTADGAQLRVYTVRRLGN